MTVYAVAVDAQDNIYVAGSGSAVGVPGLSVGYDATPDGTDAFVAKIDRNGSPVWATYVGGTDRSVQFGSARLVVFDIARAIAVDASGQVYIAGTTAAGNFPTAGAFQASRLGEIDGFVAKLSADGRRLLYSSYLGANGESMSADGISAGPAGEVWINALSPQQRWLAAHDLSGGTGRRMILKLNPSGMPVWSTRVALQTAGGFAVDGAGRAVLAGGHCTPMRECRQVLLRLDPSGGHLQFSTTFLNRNADLFRASVALLPGGRAAFSGVAFDPLPVRNAWAEPPACPFGAGGCGEAFLAIANDGGELETVSYLDLGERATLLTADQFGRVTIALDTGRPNLPLARPVVDHHVDGPVYVSRDRATTWRVEGRETIPGGDIADLVFNRLRHTVYAVANAIFESREEPLSWRLDTQGGLGLDVWYRVAVDPRQPSIRYGILGDHVYRHDDGAAQWRIVNRSAAGTYRRAVTVSPHDSSVWIAGNAGVTMSTTGGDSWTDRSAGLPNLAGSSPTVEHLEFDPQRAGVVYAMTQVGLYRTRDIGATWELLTGGIAPTPAVRAIAFDPTDSNTLLVAALNHGLLKSTDAGQTWTRNLEGSRIAVVRTDHMKRHIVYAGGLDAEGRNVFYRSIDHGETWHRAGEGLQMRAEPFRLVVDPLDSAKLYLGSSSYQGVPYVIRLQADGTTPGRYTPEFASYLGHGEVRGLAATGSGGVVAALNHAWPSSDVTQQQIVTVRIGQ